MNTYCNILQSKFSDRANSYKALEMKKYMRNKFEFFGIQAVERKNLTLSFIKENGLPSIDNFEQTIKAIYSLPQRELHYAALEIAERVISKENNDWIPLIEYLILNNSWWDTVDYIAPHITGNYFKKNAHLVQELTKKWINSNNIWLQRTCIIFQLKYKEETDTKLLLDYIKFLSKSDEFFIKKAIGWALREYSKTDHKFVINAVNKLEISEFSKKEALKWMRNKKII